MRRSASPARRVTAAAEAASGAPVRSAVTTTGSSARAVVSGRACADLAVHGAALPLPGRRAGVAHAVERADDRLEVDAAATDGAEVPVPVPVAEREVPAEHARGLRRLRPPHVLHVHVVDAVAE